MPANKKHLTASNWHRFLKITAGFVGGYTVSMSLHMALAQWLNHINVLISIAFSGFILWAVLLLLAFLAKNGWKIWGLYSLLTLLFLGFIYLGKLYHPLLP